VSKHLEFALGDRERLLLEGIRLVVRDDEADEMPRRTNRQVLEGQLVGRPVRERALPREVQEGAGGVAKAEPRERGRLGRPVQGVAQSFLRRYAATVAS
jgi:hypothetical protein